MAILHTNLPQYLTQQQLGLHLLRDS
jgi:hypothetical protein